MPKKMPRAQPEYKEMMRLIRKQVRLAERSEIFRKVRALLKGKHQDMLEMKFVQALTQYPGDIAYAEKIALREVISILPIPSEGLHNSESLRIYEFLTGMPRECITSMSAKAVLDKMSESEIFR